MLSTVSQGRRRSVTRLRRRAWTRAELAWVAGLLEGEGAFTKKCNNGTARNIVVECFMTDPDVLRKLRRVAGGRFSGPYSNGEGNKPRYQWSVSGPAAYDLMMLVLPLMCERRARRIKQLIRAYESVVDKVAIMQRMATSRIVSVRSITQWCKRRSISRHMMYKTLVGKLKQHRGWRRLQ